MKNLLKILPCLFLLRIVLLQDVFGNFGGEQQFGQPKLFVQNTILANVNGTQISVLDVMKRMDLIFYKAYPDLENSKMALYQFYLANWKDTLEEMIHTEWILADAETREIKVPDGEVKEEIEKRFGPNVPFALEKIGLSYEEALKMIRTEMLMKRMMGYFVQAKAWQEIHPQDIREAYVAYCSEHPPEEIWTYQVISLKGIQEEKMQKVYSHLVKGGKKSKMLTAELVKKPLKGDPCEVSVSEDYVLSSKEMSATHKAILSQVEVGSYSKPTVLGKDVKIFYVKNVEKKNPPSFESMTLKIREGLLQREIAKASEKYFEKLKRRYGFDEKYTKTEHLEQLTPFRVE